VKRLSAISLPFMCPLLLCAAALFASVEIAMGCTSAIVRADATRYGRTLLWKHRDTGHAHNFVERVPGNDSTFTFVALFNAGDSALAEAWIGFNEAGFAVMNTASYNLAPDTARIRDREGFIMARALARCRTIADFTSMLDAEIARGPMGVQANFGVTDATGAGAYIEASDHAYAVFPLEQAPDGVLIRSNYSYSGGERGRLGECRHENARQLLKAPAAARDICAETFTETLSRSFYDSGIQADRLAAGDNYPIDAGNMIPRRSSTASVVIEGVKAGENPARAVVMWVALGFPTASHVEAVTLDSIPPQLRPSGQQWRSEYSSEVNRRRDKAFIRKGGKGKNGKWLFNMPYLRPLMERERELSAKAYSQGRARRDAAKNGDVEATGELKEKILNQSVHNSE